MTKNSAKDGQSVFNCGYYKKIYHNYWGENIPSTNNNQLVEWKVWVSNKNHEDPNPKIII